MKGRILIAVTLAVFIYGLYSWWATRNLDSFDVNSQQYEEAESGMPPLAPVKIVSPGGPNSPATMPPAGMIIVPPETPFDPQAEVQESAEHPDRLRHPERVYSPGIANEMVDQSLSSGIASMSQQQTSLAHQEFGPEFVSNGGVFLDGGVVANDTSIDLSYSSI